MEIVHLSITHRFHGGIMKTGYQALLKEQQPDLLITHGPALGVLNRVAFGESAGYHFLVERIDELQIKVHFLCIFTKSMDKPMAITLYR